jgi:protease-4
LFGFWNGAPQSFLTKIVFLIIMATRRKRKSKKKKDYNFVLIVAFVSILIVAGLYFGAAGSVTEGIKPTIAVIKVQGVIGSNSAEEIIGLLDEVSKDVAVKAIILEINSPGGTVVASEEIANKVKEIDKPVVAWIRETGASGAYWVASAADYVVADRASMTGSIGVTASYLEFSGLMDEYGVKYERLVTGDYKDTGSPFKELSKEERGYLEGKINSINDMFIQEVAENRDLSEGQVTRLATGEIFLGEEAYSLGLVDLLGGEKEAQAAAESLAELKTSKLIKIEPARSLFDLIRKDVGVMFYQIGRGIGDSWQPAYESEIVLKAEL